MIAPPLGHQAVAHRLSLRVRHHLSGLQVLDLDTGLAVTEHHHRAAALRRGNVMGGCLLRIRACAMDRDRSGRDHRSKYREDYPFGSHFRLVEWEPSDLGAINSSRTAARAGGRVCRAIEGTRIAPLPDCGPTG